MKAALLDMSMQAFVSDVVSHAVADVVLPKMKESRAKYATKKRPAREPAKKNVKKAE